jgi:catechol 2,3-dioxygenase-like lactoylglutathione lyase family enzyme
MTLSDSSINGFVRVTNADKARAFYEGVLGLRCVEDNPYVTVFQSGTTKVVAQKVKKFRPIAATVLGWEVKNILKAVAALRDRGVVFERYAGMDQDKLGIWTSPDGKVAWFKDPDGNILSVSEH